MILKLVLFCFFSSFSFSYFYDSNAIKAENILKSFDIDASFQIDSNLMQMYYEETTGNKWEHFIESFENGYEYVPILKQMLLDSNVPSEFLYLAMAESEFKIIAHSAKKASGIWQIIPSTALSLGLKIDEFIDERRDPIKSTEAAIKYLKFLKEKTGKWYLAAMAYNCGIGRLQRAIKEAKSDDINVLMDPDKKYIPAETRSYIRMILSMSLAFNNISELNNAKKSYFLNRGVTSSIALVKVDSGVSLESIAKGAGLKLQELKKYNRQFKYDFLPLKKGEYDVYLPYENLLSFKQNFKPIKVNLDKYILTYKVKKGDTLYSISRKYNVSIESIKSINNLKKTLLRINQKLLIPLSSGYKIANLKKKVKKN